jgi:hypothetical protein
VLITICIALGIISSFCESLPTANDIGDPVPETGNIRFPWIEQDTETTSRGRKEIIDLRTAKSLSNMHISEWVSFTLEHVHVLALLLGISFFLT